METFVAVGVAVAALLAALAWRVVRIVRVRRGIASGLRDADAGVRTAAVVQAAELGLASTAPMLLRAVRDERDPEVLRQVVETVAARQWEPASTARIVELRLWAKVYAERHREVHRGGDVDAPLLPGVAGAVPPPSLDPARADEFRTRTTEVGGSAAAAATPSEPAGPSYGQGAADDDAMGRVRVLVTGAGGPAGVAVIRALRSRGHHVVAVDADAEAVGLRLADASATVPRCTSPTYLAALLRVATVHDAQALICTVAEEYLALADAGPLLEEAGLRSLVPPRAALEVCLDKWRFAEHVRADGIPVPATALGEVGTVPGPWIVKPRHGRGSRGVLACESRTQVAAALKRDRDAVVQTRLPGREFTADTLCDHEGTLVGAVARWRDETRGGISTRGTTFSDPAVLDAVTRTLKSVGHVGPANVQGFVAADGTVGIHEVNPRFSGGLPLSLAAGADLVEEHLRDVMGLPARPERVVGRDGVTMYRYFCEVFEG